MYVLVFRNNISSWLVKNLNLKQYQSDKIVNLKLFKSLKMNPKPKKKIF